MKKILIAWLAALLMTFAGLAWAAIDINSATTTELEALKGIGPAKAKAIVEFREKNGPFATVDDLKKVKGIGAKTLEKLKPELTVGGAASTTDAPKPTPAPVAAPKPAPAPAAAPAPKPAPAPATPK